MTNDNKSIVENMEDSREKAYRFVAYTAMTFSFVAIVSTCLTLPLVHNYVTSLHERVNDVLIECQQSAEGILGEADTYQNAKRVVFEDTVQTSRNRTLVKRQAPCSGCCLPGDAGPQGRPGKPGRPVRLFLKN